MTSFQKWLVLRESVENNITRIDDENYQVNVKLPKRSSVGPPLPGKKPMVLPPEGKPMSSISLEMANKKSIIESAVKIFNDAKINNSEFTEKVAQELKRPEYAAHIPNDPKYNYLSHLPTNPHSRVWIVNESKARIVGGTEYNDSQVFKVNITLPTVEEVAKNWVLTVKKNMGG